MNLTTARSVLIADEDPGVAAPAAVQVVASDGAQDDQAPWVAYLVNVYPTVSHSFIRTEIQSLERRGLRVQRFTIRRSGGRFAPCPDHDEDRKTLALLDGNLLPLLGSLAIFVRRRPATTLRLIFSACLSGGPATVVRRIAYVLEAAELACRLEAQGIAHVHAHFGTNPAAVARLAAKLSPLTYSFTAHGPDEFDAPLTLDLHGKIAEAAFVVGVSEFGRGQLMRWSQASDWDRIKVVRCSVAPDFLLKRRESRRGLDSHRLVCVARLNAQKGLPLLIEAVAIVAARRPVVLRIAGEGEDRASLEAQVVRLGLEDHVHFVGWAGPERVREELLAARAFVLPSFAEGLPVVLMEAMALARPVITTAIAGIPELVDRDAGWLIPSGSVEALADAMESCLSAEARQLAAMGRAGRARVRERHDPARNGELLAGLLRPFVTRLEQRPIMRLGG